MGLQNEKKVKMEAGEVVAVWNALRLVAWLFRWRRRGSAHIEVPNLPKFSILP
jgi:hypothetical protein